MSALQQGEFEVVTSVDQYVAEREFKTVNLTVTGADGHYVVSVDQSLLRVAFQKLCEVTFVIDVASVAGAVFQDPPLSFFDNNTPAMTMPLNPQSPTQAKMLWANIDPAFEGRSFDYRLRLKVGDVSVIHDPTVQNDPPPVPTP